MRRHRDNVSTSIFDILTPLDEALRFQFVEDGDHRGPVHAKPLCDILLGKWDAIVDHQKDRTLSTGDAMRLERSGSQLVEPLVSVFHQVSEPVIKCGRRSIGHGDFGKWHANILLAH
jgi:hypothetical protein